MSKYIKQALFIGGHYNFVPPDVSHSKWDMQDWIKYIDQKGDWMPLLQAGQVPIKKDQVPTALRLQEKINNDNQFIVMVKGYDGDFKNFTGIYPDDYKGWTDAEIINAMQDYRAIEIWC